MASLRHCVCITIATPAWCAGSLLVSLLQEGSLTGSRSFLETPDVFADLVWVVSLPYLRVLDNCPTSGFSNSIDFLDFQFDSEANTFMPVW